MRSWRLLRGIRDKLVVSFSVLVVSIAVFFIAFFPARIEEQAMRATVAKAEAISNMTAYSLEAALHFGDTVAVGDVITEVARRQQLRFIVVLDAWGSQVGVRGLAPVVQPDRRERSHGRMTSDGSTYISTVSVKRGGAYLGTLAIGISLAELRKEILAARRLAWLVGSSIFAVGLLIVFAISTLVTRPLTAVSKTVGRIAAGDLGLRAEETSDIEVAELVRSFNGMVANLVRAQDDLAKNNQQLEALVGTRTAKLRKSIRKHRRAREALSVSEAQARNASDMMRSLIDLAPQPIVAANLDWEITWWNRAAEELFGWTSEEVMGRAVPNIPADQRQDFELTRALLKTGEAPRTAEVVRARKDGSRVPVLMAMGVLRDLQSKPNGYIAFVTDLTDRKSLENQLLQAQKMEAVGRLAGGIAHDFNNILTVIMGCASILESSSLSEADLEEASEISAAAARAARLTRQLLTFSQQQIEQPHIVAIGDIIRKVEPMLRRVIVDNVQLRVEFGENCPVMADPHQLEQVLMNLVVNATDAMPDGGMIKITTEETRVLPGMTSEVPVGRYARMTVSDTGVGMDAAILQKIFEPFFTTKELGTGTGLGLSTSYAIVSHIGGYIRVSSEPGSGTSFRVYLPHAGNAELDSAEAPASIEHQPIETLTIMVVDDEKAVRQVVRRTLQRLGHRVLEADSGKAALAAVAAHEGSLDMVLTDVMMPGMSGRELAAQLADAYPMLRVIFMSGYAELEVHPDGTSTSRNAFLQKPFSVAEIESTVRQISDAQ